MNTLLTFDLFDGAPEKYEAAHAILRKWGFLRQVPGSSGGRVLLPESAAASNRRDDADALGQAMWTMLEINGLKPQRLAVAAKGDVWARSVD